METLREELEFLHISTFNLSFSCQTFIATQNMQLNGENSSEASRLLENEHSNYQSRDDYDWNVEIDVKGQVNTGPEEEFTGFSFKKLLQYTGPGKRKVICFMYT